MPSIALSSRRFMLGGWLSEQRRSQPVALKPEILNPNLSPTLSPTLTPKNLPIFKDLHKEIRIGIPNKKGRFYRVQVEP